MRLLRLVLLLLLLFPGTAIAATAPGAPGQKTVWAEADKDGFGTSTTTQSKVWHTLDDGALTEVYYPDLGTPSVRDLQFVVSDGRTFSDREREDASHQIQLTDPRSLSYRQVNSTAGDALVTQDKTAGSALVASPGFTRTSNGYLGTSDGWQDLRSDHRMDWTYTAAPNGNVVQTGQTALDGVTQQHMTLVIGLGARRTDALSTARAALTNGYDAAAASYA